MREQHIEIVGENYSVQNAAKKKQLNIHMQLLQLRWDLELLNY